MGIGFNGIVIKRKGEKIPWEEIPDIELKIFHGRVLLVQYLINAREKI